MWKVVKGQFAENQVRNVPQITPIAFPHSTAEKFCISAYRKSMVHSHCATDVQPIYSSVQHPAVPSFGILCGMFSKERYFFTISINFKNSSISQVSHHFAGQCDWLQFV